MIKKILLKLLLRLYLGKNRDINKLTIEQEFKKFLFNDRSDIGYILRTYLTTSTISYWEASSDYERNIEKGGALMLKLILDLHKAAMIADDVEKLPERKIQKFRSLKNNLLAETTNHKTQ
jgi:hypothetical protein